MKYPFQVNINCETLFNSMISIALCSGGKHLNLLQWLKFQILNFSKLIVDIKYSYNVLEYVTLLLLILCVHFRAYIFQLFESGTLYGAA